MKKKVGGPRREESLSRERIIEASIELLDSSGESGLTFRALAERLATGPGAIYWHVDNKTDLLTAACDSIVARTIKALPGDATPAESVRAVALGMFHAFDAHPWVGSALHNAPGELPVVRIFEAIGAQVRELGVPEDRQWKVSSALLHYILGVSGQNAANSQVARVMGLDRTNFLKALSGTWSELDAEEFPFVRSIAAELPAHDDLADFLAGIDLILGGIGAGRGG